MLDSIKIIVLLIWPGYALFFRVVLFSETDLLLLWGIDVLLRVLIPGGTLFFLLGKGRITLGEIGLTSRFVLGSVVAGLLLCMGNLLMGWTIWPVLATFLSARPYVAHLYPEAELLRVVAIAYVCVASGVMEEIIARGVVVSQLQKHLPSAPLVLLLSCLVFAGGHWGGGSALIAYTFVWAILPTLWFLKRKTLWAPITGHVVYNCITIPQLV